MVGFAIFIFVVILVICITNDLGKDQNSATIRIMNGERTLSSASGPTVDTALKNLFDKLYNQAQELKTSDSVQRRIDQMQCALNDSGKKASIKTREYCSILLIQTQIRRDRLIDDENRRQHQAPVQQKYSPPKQREHVHTPNTPNPWQEKNKSHYKQMAAEQRRLLTPSLRYDILVRDNFRCKICGASAEDGVKLHVDHILPVSKGGKTVESNLRTLCERCNLGKSNKIEPPIVLHTNPSPVIQEEKHKSDCNLTFSEAIEMLNKQEIRYVDRTDRGGCFWIELTPESQQLLQGKQIDGKHIYTANHAKAFSNAPAMFIK